MFRQKKVIWIFLLATVLFMGQKAQAAGGYDIEQYHVDVNVTPYNTYEITESITVNYTEYRHGIYRNLPLVNRVYRTDGSSDVVNARVEKVECSDKKKISVDNSICQIRIGDEDEEIIGEKDYTLSYNYVMGKDVLSGADEFYFNIVGTEWEDTTIQNVTFSIHMPESFDEKKIGFSYGFSGSVNTDGIWYSIQGNTINGMLNKDIVLRSGEGLTIRLELPEGYFKKDNSMELLPSIVFFLGIVIIGVGYLLWNKYGKDDPYVETVEFYPPDGYNSAELGFFYKGVVTGEDIVSLVVYLAQKGYLRIIEGAGKNNQGFTLMKEKEYDGSNPYEREFFQGLFQKGDFVTDADLNNTFYVTIKSITKQLNKTYMKKIFYPNSLNKDWSLYLVLTAMYFMSCWNPVYHNSYNIFSTVYAIGVSEFLFIFMSSALFAFGKVWEKILSGVIVGIFAIFMSFVFLSNGFALADKSYLYAFIFTLLTTLAVAFFSHILPKRTHWGNQILGRSLGFKRFLETAEKPKLEAMVAENPEYFYEILPYTYVLGVSKEWMEKFETMLSEPPRWYQGHSGSHFSPTRFNTFMSSTMSRANSTMTSSPRSSGGGFSGGGSGGGGGGSW